MRCSCGVGHSTFGECMRAKNFRVGYCRSWKNHDYTHARRNERELAEYKRAREQGIQPAGTAIQQIRKALDVSDKRGSAYDAGTTSSFLES